MEMKALGGFVIVAAVFLLDLGGVTSSHRLFFLH